MADFVPSFAARHSVCRRAGHCAALPVLSDFKEIVVIGQTIAAFERAHPGVTMHSERGTSSGEQYVQKLLMEQAAGLTPFVRQDPSVNLNEYYLQMVNEFRNGDKLYVLPRDIAPIGLVYYKKSLLVLFLRGSVTLCRALVMFGLKD